MSASNDVKIVCYKNLKLIEFPADLGEYTYILFCPEGLTVAENCIEEMIAVLNAGERHGAVCPAEKQLEADMPRWSVVPLPKHPCVMFKAEVFKHLGWSGQNISDVCAYINQYGFNTLVANHAIVPILGTQRELVCEESSETDELFHKYRYMKSAVYWYENHQIHPAVYFADLLDKERRGKKRVLYSLYEISQTYNGSVKMSLALLDSFYKLFADKYEISVMAKKSTDKYYNLSKRYSNVYHPENIEGCFDLAYVPTQIYDVEHMILLNRHCLKYVFCMLDIITIRSEYLLQKTTERERIFRDSIRYCDGLCAISEFSMEDTRTYYCDEFADRKIAQKVVYLGMDAKRQIVSDIASLPYTQYYVVVGNAYKHKMIPETAAFARKSKHNYVIIGSEREGFLSGNVYGMKSGQIAADTMAAIMANATAIIYPSVYEGFGLPFLEGMMYKKHLIARDNQLNRELTNYFASYSDSVHLFKEMSELEVILDEVAANPAVKTSGKIEIRSWNQVAEETESFLADVLAMPIDTKLLTRRWQNYNYIAQIHRSYTRGKRQRNAVSRKRAPWLDDFLRGLTERFPRLYRVYCNIMLYKK